MTPAASHGAERKCIASGEVKPKGELLRFVLGPDAQVVFDVKGKLPGRGLWLSARLDMLQTAAAKNMFSRAAKAQAKVPGDLVEQVVNQLRQACLNRLGLARGAGFVVQGFDNVKVQAKKERSGVLIEAADGGQDGREKIERLAPGVPVVALFTAGELGQALGRDNAVHIVLRPGKMAEAFLQDAMRLAGVLDRPLEGGETE